MFTCPLCRENWIISAKLCDKCERVRHLMSIYGQQQVISVLEKCLVIEKMKNIDKKEENQ